jgi:transposase InsO family protein
MSQRARTNTRLVDEIRQAHHDSRKTYGSPRVHAALIQKGVLCGHNRIARLMKQNGIVAQRQRHYKRHRATSHGRNLTANLVNRNFQVPTPNKVWASDITVIWTGSGWLYLAIVMDLYSRKIIGWAMQTRMTDDLVIYAVRMAVDHRRPTGALIHHSDQGSQYASESFRGALKENRIIPSMSRKGNCYDNAVVESFFKTLKAELCKENRFKTRDEGRSQIFEYIEVFYNRKRLHSTLGYRSPDEYERIRLLKPSVR